MWTLITSISKIKLVTDPTMSYYRNGTKTFQVLNGGKFNFRVSILLNLTGFTNPNFNYSKAGLSVLGYEN
ncbi:hypothetical protein GCM10028791_19780 [Echinicola sediminis]